MEGMEGSRRHLVASAVVMGALVTIAVVSAGCWDDAGSPPSPRPPARAAPITTTEPAIAFAPIIVLHGDEDLLPIGADEFVGHSSLGWANDPCFIDDTLAIGRPRLRLDRDEPKPAIDQRKLAGASAPYRHRPLRDSCTGRRPMAFTTAQRTRPYGAGRAAGLRRGEGFQLNLLTDRLDGARALSDITDGRLPAVPVYYVLHRTRIGGRPGLRLSYWLLYGAQRPHPEAAGDAFGHEGDWERLDVLVRRARAQNAWMPIAARFYTHGRSRDVPWRLLEARGAHLVAYAARGSHALYPRPGTHTVTLGTARSRLAIQDHTSRCPDCLTWRTWQRLRPAQAQRWYGYGGAWGEAGNDSSTTGPLGPSPFTE
jgi:hypothetical protein